MSDELLPCIEIETAANPNAAVIWLHGLGADGNDFVPIVPELGLPRTLAARFVFPHAPVRPVTINNGMRMRAWYDISAADFNRRADLGGVRASSSALGRLIEREAGRGIAAERIVLAGFSQGGAIALYAGVRYPQRLAGIMVLSSYLVDAEALASEASAANRSVPIFMAHGTADPVVQFQWGETSKRLLEAQGYAVEWHSYRMEHSVCLEEVHSIGAWLSRVLA
ncbi:MAG TPA: alpha/beta fold hydrolase [Casimicrobiaceae bacterium]|nr:alpha/beta fold hydrolase [Casimicrobiaceae bacterium]